MGVTNQLTATHNFAMCSLLSVLFSSKELSNQPLSPAFAPCPVQLWPGSVPWVLPDKPSSPGFAARTVDVDRRASTA
jgi:hypothetical protein